MPQHFVEIAPILAKTGPRSTECSPARAEIGHNSAAVETEPSSVDSGPTQAKVARNSAELGPQIWMEHPEVRSKGRPEFCSEMGTRVPLAPMFSRKHPF